MKKVMFFAAAVAMFGACGPQGQNNESEEKSQTTENTEENAENEEEEVEFPYYAGAEFDESKAIGVEEFNKKIADFEGDSMRVTLNADITSACKKKGCWMKLDMAEEDEVMVRFKDYDFFVPLNSGGRETTVNGVVYYDTISVQQLKHYAEDGGADADSIAKITEPEVTLAFLADGVVVK